MRECMHRLRRKYRPDWKEPKKKDYNIKEEGQRDWNTLGSKEWVKTDAGQETYAVAAVLADEKWVGRINL